MARKDIGTSWTRDTRNAMNDNFIELYNEYLGAGNNAADAKRLANEALNTANKAKSEAESTQEQLDNIILNDGTGNAEVIQARGNEPLLKDRLNKTDQQLTQVDVQLNTKIDQFKTEFDQQLADTTNEVAEGVQAISMPENISTTKTKSPKLIIVGDTDDKLNVVQWNGTNYVVYELDAAPGTENLSVGGAWELIRLKKAILANDVYVAKSTYDVGSIIGTIDTLYAPSHRNTIENYSIYTHPDEVQSSFLSASGDGFGIGCYGLVRSNAVSEVSWKVKTGTNRKCNMLVFATTTGSKSADVLVNGEVVYSFDPTKMALGTNLTYKVIEFEIPTRVNLNGEVIVTLRNNDTSNKKVYFSCVNYLKLKDYDGRDIDFYKVFTTSQKWIDHAGASDYAIFDHDLQLWCGSYHGGETRQSTRMTYSSLTTWTPTTQWDTGRIAMRNKVDVPVGWYITPSFQLQQLTDINGKGKMLSLLDWDTDGSLQLNFSFFDGSITIETFYTALTTTHISFDYIRYPKYEQLPSTGANLPLDNSEGYVIQSNLTKGLSLGQRFTKFGRRYVPDITKKDGWILNNDTYYKKLYYGFAEGYKNGVKIKSLQFRKALDFMSM